MFAHRAPPEPAAKRAAMQEDNEHVRYRPRAGHAPGSGMSVRARRRRGPDWLHPGWSWTVGRAWVITALSASVTLVLGAVLSALPALLTGSWSDPQTRGQTWVLLGFIVASLAAAVTAI